MPGTAVSAGGVPTARDGGQALRAVRRLPNVSMVVAFFAGALVAEVVRDRAGAFLAAFRAAAGVAGAFFGGAFFAAAAFAVGLRVGVAVVADVSFFRATRAVVAVGFSPGDLAALAPVARFVAAATFFAAAFRFIGAFLAPVDFRAPLGRLPGGTAFLPAVILVLLRSAGVACAAAHRARRDPSARPARSRGSSPGSGRQTPGDIRRRKS